MAGKEKITYKQALVELDEILNNIENPDVDIDQLTEKIKRASFLLKSCKQMLRSAEKEVESIMNNLDED